MTTTIISREEALKHAFYPFKALAEYPDLLDRELDQATITQTVATLRRVADDAKSISTDEQLLTIAQRLNELWLTSGILDGLLGSALTPSARAAHRWTPKSVQQAEENAEALKGDITYITNTLPDFTEKLEKALPKQPGDGDKNKGAVQHQ